MGNMLNYGKFILPLFWIGFQLSDSAYTNMNNSDELDVDTFINEYIHEVKRTLKLGYEEHSISKRSLPDIDIMKLQGLDVLVGFRRVFSLPAKFPNDLILFTQCVSGLQGEQAWFAISLEATKSDPQTSLSNELVLYKYKDYVWMDVDHKPVRQGVQVATEQIGDQTYIIVAEFHAHDGHGSTVFQINSSSNSLQFVHTLSTQFPSYVIMWNWEDLEVFAAIAISENIPGKTNRYSTQSPVYRWDGSSFDMIDTLPTYNPRALTQFYIRSSMFIAVANFQNDIGDTTVESEIFRFNLDSQKFILYQKLPTEAAVDMKYFCYQAYQTSEMFLIYASAFHTDTQGNKDYNAALSVLYKLSDEEYFVPFQALQVPKVTSWTPVRNVKDTQESLILLAATEDGVISYQYDGWRFVPTGVLYGSSTFGPGHKSINVFYHDDKTFISTANKLSSGYETNVFSPRYEYNTQVENLQQQMDAWMRKMIQELSEGEAKLAKLLQIAQNAPTINDPFINLGSEVVFHDVEIDNVETLMTEVGDDDLAPQDTKDLIDLDSQLETVKYQLSDLQSRINKLSQHTLTVYEDVVESTANIQCVPICEVQDLVVGQVNGEKFAEFIAHTVNINEPVEIQEEIEFEHLALIDPLDAKTINGHPAESLEDLFKNVVLYQELKVKGDVILKSDLFVGGALDGIIINGGDNAIEDEVIIHPSTFLESLNTSQLVLTDGILSQVNFGEFTHSTLKTEGNQIITEYQEFGKIDADKVEAYGGLYKAFNRNPYHKQPLPCEGEVLTHEPILGAKAAGSDSNAIINDESFYEEIIIPHDVIIYGTVLIENGSLTAKDVVDSKHSIAATQLMKLGIPLNQSVIDNHFEFHASFKAENLTVDTLNGIHLESLVDPASSDCVVISGKKEFNGDLIVNGTINVTQTLSGQMLRDTPTEIHLNKLSVLSIESTNVKIDGHNWEDLATRRENSHIYVEKLHVKGDVTAKNVMVRGRINNFHLESLLNDTVFDDGKTYDIPGEKTFANQLKISKLILETLNGIDVNTLTPNYVCKQHLSQAKVVKVDNLTYTGLMDGIEADMFGQWLLTEGDQTVFGSQMIDSWQADNMIMAPEGTFNSIHIQQLLDEAIFLTDNVTLGNIVFENPVSTSRVYVGGRLRGLQIPEDILVSDAGSMQHVTAHKHIHGNVTIQGGFQPNGLINSINLTDYCQTLALNTTNLIILGNATFNEEPNIVSSVNNKTRAELLKRASFIDQDLNITAPLMMNAVQFHNLDVETINNNNVEEILSNLVSLSQDQVINGTFYFSTVTMHGGLEAKKASVGGTVQGLHLQSFIKSVLLDGEDQEITGTADFDILFVEGKLENKGFVNGLNLSTDVMLTIPSNRSIPLIKVLNLTVSDLKLPHGALVSGVDLDKWNKTAVKKSANNIITGNLVFKGQFDSANGIRVKGLVNGVPFDKDHLLMLEGSQEVIGVKTFSSLARVKINRMQVRGYMNGINMTEFYNELVTAEGNIRISGHKKFTSPIYADRVFLPEMYQGYNLTWLETKLASPLPWEQYYQQLKNIEDMQQLADISLAGRAYYLKNMTLMQDLEGIVLNAFPLKTSNSTVLAVVRISNNKTTLSFLHWNTNYSMFLNTPGSLQLFLKTAPSGIQTVLLPGGDIAAYITSYLPTNSSLSISHGELFILKNGHINQSKVKGGRPGSAVLAFKNYNSRTCFVLVMNMCTVFCVTDSGRKVILPSFSCQNITEVTSLSTEKTIHLIGLQVGSENRVIVWKLLGKTFTRVQSLMQFNPVSIAATMAPRPQIAVATRHQVGHSHPETIDIYSFNEETSQLFLEESLPSISPNKVLFARLPSNETVLYIGSGNPASPLEVFVYRGIMGYQRLMVETTLPTLIDICPFTDNHHRHFVIASSKQKTYILQALFKGEFPL